MWYSWQVLLGDAVEISLISAVIYSGLRWLHRDDDNRLLLSAYAYWALIAGAWFVSFYTLFNFLVMSIPCLVAAFIIMHKEQLQKNYLQKKKAVVADYTAEWIDCLMRSLLYAMNEGVACAVIVENKDPLAFDLPFALDAQLSLELMHMVRCSKQFDPTLLMWLNRNGRFVGFNAQPKASKSSHDWQFDALIITQKTDACVIGIDPVSRSFVVIAQGKQVEGVNVKSVVHLLKHYLFGIKLSHEEKRDDHASIIQKGSLHEERP
jgi:hypothetical protein